MTCFMGRNKEIMSSERQKLKRVLSRTDILALAFGTMIGWVWMMHAGEWVKNAGVIGAIAAFLIGGTMCIFVGMTYAELTSAFPLAGGELVFSFRGLGYFWSWVTGWAISFAYIGVAAWEGIAISTAVDYLFRLPKEAYLWTIGGYEVYFTWSAVGIAAAVILTALNLFGVKPAAVFQIMGTLAMVITGIIFISGGLAFGNPFYAAPAFTDHVGMKAVLLITPSMYIGFDVISKSAEEINMPLKDAGKVLILSIVLACLWYIMMIAGIALSAPPELRESAPVPVADSISYAFKTPIFGKIMILGGICGIITSWNGFIVGASRVLFAMGRARMLPRIFGAVHPKHQTPMASTILVGIFCCMAPLLGQKALVWFIDVAAFGTVIAYLLVSISFIMIRRKEPELKRPFSVKNWKLIGTGAIATSVFFLILFAPISPNALNWPEWAIISAWIAIGIIFAAWPGVSFSGISRQERELLMFGDEYSREAIRDK